MAKNNKNKKAMPPMGKKRGPKNAGKTLSRLLGYVFKGYPVRITLVLLCLFLSSFATVQSSKFIETLINNIDAISESVKTGTALELIDYTPLLTEIIKIVIIFSVGIVSAFLSNFYWLELLKAF